MRELQCAVGCAAASPEAVRAEAETQAAYRQQLRRRLADLQDAAAGAATGDTELAALERKAVTARSQLEIAPCPVDGARHAAVCRGAGVLRAADAGAASCGQRSAVIESSDRDRRRRRSRCCSKAQSCGGAATTRASRMASSTLRKKRNMAEWGATLPSTLPASRAWNAVSPSSASCVRPQPGAVLSSR